MDTSIAEGQVLEFHGASGDRLVLSSSAPLSGGEFLMARYADASGPYPQDGKPWSTMRCLCLGRRKVENARKNPYFAQKAPLAAEPETRVERCEVVFEQDGVMLVEYPPRGRQHGAVIERIDRDGGTHAPDGTRRHWHEATDRRSPVPPRTAEVRPARG